MARIESIETGHFRIAPETEIADSTHGDIRAFELNTVRVRDADGAQGFGYTFTVGRNGAAIDATLRVEIAELLRGREADDIARRWHECW